MAGKYFLRDDSLITILGLVLFAFLVTSIETRPLANTVVEKAPIVADTVVEKAPIVADNLDMKKEDTPLELQMEQFDRILEDELSPEDVLLQQEAVALEEDGPFQPVPMPTDFRSYDILPRDGYVTLDELIDVTGAKENVGQAFEASDTDGDGKLSEAEFDEAPWALQGEPNVTDASEVDLQTEEENLPIETDEE